VKVGADDDWLAKSLVNGRPYRADDKSHISIATLWQCSLVTKTVLAGGQRFMCRDAVMQVWCDVFRARVGATGGATRSDDASHAGVQGSADRVPSSFHPTPILATPTCVLNVVILSETFVEVVSVSCYLVALQLLHGQPVSSYQTLPPGLTSRPLHPQRTSTWTSDISSWVSRPPLR
jgi:hypothetical protein